MGRYPKLKSGYQRTAVNCADKTVGHYYWLPKGQKWQFKARGIQLSRNWERKRTSHHQHPYFIKAKDSDAERVWRWDQVARRSDEAVWSWLKIIIKKIWLWCDSYKGRLWESYIRLYGIGYGSFSVSCLTAKLWDGSGLLGMAEEMIYRL